MELTPQKISFSGTSAKNVNYAVDLELFAEIDVENSKQHHTSRGIDFVLRKKELKVEFWPRLLKDKKRYHFLKTDFDKVCEESGDFSDSLNV